MNPCLTGLPERIASKIDASGSCWLWTASLNPSGYGQVKWGGTTWRAHRLVYQLLVADIAGCLLKRLCDNRACVNPAHLERVTPPENCTARGCEREPKAQGLCGLHYRRLRKLGRTDLPSILERFWARVEKTDDCWIWTGARNAEGYGRARAVPQVGTTQQAHRIAYTLTTGPIPGDLPLDHLCRNPSCVNPAHLEPVTTAENILRGASPGANAVRTNRCKRGHEFTSENTYWRPDGKGRHCRTCDKARR